MLELVNHGLPLLQMPLSNLIHSISLIALMLVEFNHALGQHEQELATTMR